MCWKKSKSVESIECFICCSEDGKSDNEKIFEMQFNQKYMSYPLIPLAKAYNCQCSTLYAHNKCLLYLARCPSCRKFEMPNLYVETRYDYYLKPFLDYLKQDPKRIYKMYKIIICYLAFLMFMLFLMDLNKKALGMIIPHKSTLSLILASFIGITFGLSLYILVVLDDYFKKYWLYDYKTEKCMVFYEHRR
jgi:hypothetical protein